LLLEEEMPESEVESHAKVIRAACNLKLAIITRFKSRMAENTTPTHLS
jgi:hypothetical protein